MPLTRLPFPASRNLEKSCHVALWTSDAAVNTVTESGKILAGKEGREKQRKQRHMKKKKELYLKYGNMVWFFSCVSYPGIAEEGRERIG